MGERRILTPLAVRSSQDAIQIDWADGHPSRYNPRDVRLACRCAACVDEVTHQPILQPERVPLNVKPKAIEVVGNYALQIYWTDGHSSGLYTYDHLREICDCETCAKPRSFNV